MKKQLSTLLLIILLVLTVGLSLVNRQNVVVHYIFGQFQLPLILVIVGSILTGVLLTYLFGIRNRLTLRHDVKSLQKEVTSLKEALTAKEGEVTSLKATLKKMKKDEAKTASQDAEQ